jgi:hypothetical protein
VLAKALPTLPTSAPFAHNPPGLIEKISHLGGHVTEARRSAEDDRVGFCQLRWCCHGHMGECRASGVRAALFQYLVGDEFRHLP